MLTDQELKRAKSKYNMQKAMCKNRIDQLGNPIEMRLTFEEWINIWLSSGHWHERGNKKGCWLMSRYNDLGHYEVGNVEIKTKEANSIETCKSSHWQTNITVARQQASQDPVSRANKKRAAQKRSATNSWKVNHKIANQKAHGKPISCDGVIYASLRLAGNAIAPSHINHKGSWIGNQIKKFPERFFYIAK